MKKRFTRAEKRERTREELISAADSLFTGQGFHATSVDEIALEAGYTKGAVYSNFASKDELFLAVYDAHAVGRQRAYAQAVAGTSTLEEGLRAMSWEMTGGVYADPRWVPVLIEFWTHASRQEALCRQVSERH